MARRWIALGQRWAWAVPASALGLTAVTVCSAFGAPQARLVWIAFGVYSSAALGVYGVAVFACGLIGAGRPRAHAVPAMPGARVLLLHALWLAGGAALIAVAAAGPIARLLPESLAFHGEIARVLAWHGGVGLAALAGFALSRLRGLGAYPFWLAGVAHLGARILTADDLVLFGQGREALVDVGSLLLVFACCAASSGARLRPWLVRASVAASCAAAVSAMLMLDLNAARRVELAANHPGPTALVARWRAWLDLDGDGFATVLGGGDCDDANPRVHPAALEVVGNGLDDNCIGGDLARVAEPVLPRLRPGGPRRNLLLVTIDALRADVSGPDQREPRPMPGLHAFAASAALFPRAYVHAPYTTDSLQSLLTGHLPMNMTVGTHWLGAEPDLPQLLRGAGYATQVVHSFWLRDPRSQRTAETTTFLLNFEANDRTLAERNRNPRAVTSAETTERALAHFERLRNGDRPFFLWVHYFDLHAEYAEREGTPFAGDTPRGRYLQEAFATDRDLTRLLRRVEASGFFDDGIAVVMGDHGEMFGEHDRHQHALWLNEECLRTTLLLRGPGVAAGRYDTRVRAVDVAPTVLELAAGIEIHADGSSLLPILNGRERADRDVFARSTYADSIYRRAAIVGPWKLEQDVPAGTLNLFQLDRDPGEHEDLASQQPAVRERLLQRLGEAFDHAMNDRILERRKR